jgi:YfiH family protein
VNKPQEKIIDGVWKPGIFQSIPEISYGAATKLFASKNLAQEINLLVSEENIIRAWLVHGNNVAVVDENFFKISADEKAEIIKNTDGLITSMPNIALSITAADCTPVALYDQAHHVICLLHVGWRGACSFIINNALEKMHTTFGVRARDLIVSVGPSIAALDYEVDTPVYEKFKEQYGDKELETFFIPKSAGKYFLNVPEAIRLQLIEAGIVPDNIEFSHYSTTQNNVFFPSARKAGGVKNVTPIVFMMSLRE